METPTLGFDWDRWNIAKCERHGVVITEIESLFKAGARIAPDLKHSDMEDRFIATGRNAAGRPMFVAFTVRVRGGRGLVRPVSARYMHRKEAQRYDKQS